MIFDHISKIPPHGGRELICHAISLHPISLRNISRQKICKIIKTLVCLSARQILSQGPSILFRPINLDTVLTGGWASIALAPPLPSRLFEALMMMNVPTFGTSSKSMQMPLLQSGIFYVELTSFVEFQCQSLTKIWCMSY